MQKRPASTRLKLHVQVRVKRRFRWRNATLVDLSREGGCLFGTNGLKSGDTMTLDMPVFGAVRAIVKWKTCNKTGCEFVQPLDPVIFDAAVLRWKTDRLSRLVNRTMLRAPNQFEHLKRLIRIRNG